jgi:hypothetical protein
MLQQAIIRQMGVAAYRAAFEGKRMAFRHGAGPAVLLHPGAAPGTTFMLDGEDAVIDDTGETMAIDGNVHDIVQVDRVIPEDMVISVGRSSKHVDVDAFLRRAAFDTGVEPERMLVVVGANGKSDVAIAPSMAWIHPLIRHTDCDASCVQQFIDKFRVGNVTAELLERVFGQRNLTLVEGGNCRALLPFLARVVVVIDGGTTHIEGRYTHTVAQLLERAGSPLFLHGLPLHSTHARLWTLSPFAHGVVHVYTKQMVQTAPRMPICVPCDAHPLGNAAIDMRAPLPVPAQVTAAYLKHLIASRPVTTSRAQCIYRVLSPHTDAAALHATLLAMSPAMATAPPCPVRPAFEAHVRRAITHE